MSNGDHKPHHKPDGASDRGREWAEGNTAATGGLRRRSGAKPLAFKQIETQIFESEAGFLPGGDGLNRLEWLFARMFQIAAGPDSSEARQAVQYLLDRALGKATVKVEMKGMRLDLMGILDRAAFAKVDAVLGPREETPDYDPFALPPAEG